MQNYYILNMETSKLELHFDRAAYAALTDAQKAEIKGAFLWSSYGKCWVSRTKNNHWRAEQIAKALELADAGKTGERLPFAEQVERQTERAEARAERYEERAIDAGREAHARFNSPANKTLSDMQGEPVKIGHHSEKRHRRLIERAWADMGKGAEAWQKSQHYESRAATARATASQKQLSNRGFLARRIKECEKELRDIGRALERAQAGPEEGREAWMERLCDRAEVHEDKLGFYRECLSALGGVQHSRATIKRGDRIKDRFGWLVVVRANPTTVSGKYTEQPLVGWDCKVPYAEILGHEPASSNAP